MDSSALAHLDTQLSNDWDVDLNLYKFDDQLHVRFTMQAVKNEAKSAEAGRPVFDDVPIVNVHVPGSRDVFSAVATEEYKYRFRKQWEAFQSQMEVSPEGTPLEQVPFLTVAQVAELKVMNVMTLEQLANMSDLYVQKVTGFDKLRERARRLIESAKDNAVVLKMQSELEERDNKISLLEAQLTELSAKTQKLIESSAKR